MIGKTEWTGDGSRCEYGYKMHYDCLLAIYSCIADDEILMKWEREDYYSLKKYIFAV